MSPPFAAPSQRGSRRGIGRVLLAFGLTLLSVSSSAIKPTDYFHLQDLENEPTMTPGKFADLFERFFYEFQPRVLKPEDFLAQRAGDCDDYAILGAHILGRKGYEMRLMQVKLTGDNVDHAVVYVTGENVYLDFNNRKLRRKLVKTDPTLRAVATLVADSFKQTWTTAFEFTYSYDQRWKKIGRVVVKTDSPDRDADRVQPQRQPRP